MLGSAIYSSLLVFAVIMCLKYSRLFCSVTIWAPVIRKFKYTRVRSHYWPALNPISYSSGVSKLGCLRSDSKHRPNNPSEIVVRASARSSMPAAIVNSLMVVQSMMFLLFCGNVSTDFPIDSFWNIIWDGVPEKTAEQEYATEGRRTIGWDGFCRISYAGLSTCSYWSYSNIQSYNNVINVCLACRQGEMV